MSSYEPTDSCTVNVTVAQLPGHKVLQQGHVAPLGAASDPVWYGKTRMVWLPVGEKL